MMMKDGLAVVIGATGAIGAALVAQLKAQWDAAPDHPAYAAVLGLSRHSTPPLDYADEATLAQAAQWVAEECARQNQPLRLLVVATGTLHSPAGQPERSWANLNADYLQQVFQTNALGPALVIKHFFPLLPKTGRATVGFLSAKVGSIGDNALGGWYGYRASKAALNQFVKTAAIELTRRNKDSVCIALHPGTVDSALSQPFAKTGLNVRSPDVAARELLGVLQRLGAADTGKFWDYAGRELPW
jgi:NAD(P)-dependent dehydrogenase (short-subunit alcohol dehydrogenase family)